MALNMAPNSIAKFKKISLQNILKDNFSKNNYSDNKF